MKKSNFKDIEIRYVFTEDERNKLGPTIARLSQDIQEKQDEKKSVVAEFNAEIKAIEKTFNENVNRLNNGFEMRYVPARSYKNYATSQWEYYSVENYDLLKTEAFGPYDYQFDVDETAPSEAQQFTGLDEDVPAAEGNETTNPTLFTILLRELNYWRGQLAEVETLEDQNDQIDAGMKIQEKINRIETALKTMEVQPEEEATPEATGDESNPDEDPHPGLTAAVVGTDNDGKRRPDHLIEWEHPDENADEKEHIDGMLDQENQQEPKAEPRQKDGKGRFVKRITLQSEDGTPGKEPTPGDDPAPADPVTE